MRVVPTVLAAMVILLAPLASDAQGDPSKVQEESKTIFQTILGIIIKWVFPVGAAYCFIHGIIAKGVKRGEWDMAAICVVGAVALALFPKLLQAVFGVTW